MPGVIISVVQIVVMLTAAPHFMRWVWSERNPAWVLAREAHIAAVTRGRWPTWTASTRTWSATPT